MGKDFWMKCRVHKKYHGKGTPRVTCVGCWAKYFEWQTGLNWMYLHDEGYEWLDKYVEWEVS